MSDKYSLFERLIAAMYRTLESSDIHSDGKTYFSEIKNESKKYDTGFIMGYFKDEFDKYNEPTDYIHQVMCDTGISSEDLGNKYEPLLNLIKAIHKLVNI